tara:strand:+ start:1709 stop:2122 length:414 start_codon:yes stop_codon:yes gene_type:complete
MKKSELKLMIRQVVREEIRSAMKDLIGESKTKPIKTKKVINKNNKNFTNNSLLNDVLNETAQADEWKSMGNYDTSDMNKILKHSYGDMKQEDIVTDTAVNAGVQPEQVPEHLEKALTRDYRSLMKATDEKAKATRNK